MPTYDLRCAGCGTVFEVFGQRFLRDEDRVCTACGRPGAAQRLTAIVAVRSPRHPKEPRVVGFGATSCGCGSGCAA